MISNWTAAPVGNYVHVETADLYRPNARFTTETQGYQVLTPFGKLGYSLEYSVNAITDRMEGDPPSSDDRTANRYASERRRLPGLSRVHARIAPGARLPAIQQRYMPGVYRAVHRRILAALEAYDGAPLTYRGRRIVRTWESEAAAAPSVDRLTAAFVRLVYPLWGASTTATKVRTTRSRP